MLERNNTSVYLPVKPSRKQSRTQHRIEYSRRLDMAAGNEPSPEHSENENASDNSDVRRAIDELNEEANRTAIYMSSSPSISTQFQTPRPRYQFIQDPTTSDQKVLEKVLCLIQHQWNI